ncbi:MAG TPA: response regulator [Vicinamibacterales bacterium]
MKHILVVDDDSSILSVTSRALAGYRVSIARDPDEALAAANQAASLDLLITDFLMPSMTGDELVARMREQRPSLKVLVLTGHGNILERENPAGWNSAAHLSKPVDIDILRATVAGLIGPP